MNDIAQRIWDGLPSVQPLVASAADVQARQDVVISDEEAVTLLRCIHKACYANATGDDSTAAVGDVVAAQPLSSAVKNFSWFINFVTTTLVNDWIDASVAVGDKSTSSSKVDPAASPRPAQGDEDGPVVVLTPLEEQVKSVADSILDDREPQVLLPYDGVITIPLKPKHVRSPYCNFVKTIEYAPHPAIFYRMWEQLTTGNAIDFTVFSQWFTFFYRLQIANATPSRARAAAREDWLTTLRSTGDTRMGFDDFARAAQLFAARYGKQDGEAAKVAYFEGIIDCVRLHYSAEGKPWFQLDVPSCPSIAKTTLVNARSVSRLDALDADECEEAYFREPTRNRVLITGPSGVGKTRLSRELATQLNAVYVDLYTAAIKAIDDGNAIGAAITASVEEQRPISLELRAQIAAAVLKDPATAHAGYVFDDVPTHDAAALNRYLADTGLFEPGTLPQSIVNVFSTDEVTKELAAALDAERKAIRAEHLRVRAEEREAEESKAAAKAARETKRAAKAARAERKAKIEAGEIQATEEDATVAEADDEGDVEEPVELDDDGNPMEPEAVAARNASIEKQRNRRILLEDLQYALLPLRESPEAPDVLQLSAVAPAAALCRGRRRVIEVGLHSDAAECAGHIMQRLGLTVSTIPVPVPLPDDTAENPDGSAESDLQVADAKLRVVSENPNWSFSKWRKLCPVTFFDSRVLVEGSMALSCVYRGRVYCFASKDKLSRFQQSPHPFLTQRVTGVQPVLLLKTTLDVFSEASHLSSSEIESLVATSLGLTENDLAQFGDLWKSVRGLEASRAASLAARAAADAKARAAREERLKKRLEAEAKKKKKESEKKKPAKKKEDEGAVEDAPPAEPEAEVVVVETTADVISKSIAAELSKRESFCPLLVSLLSSIDESVFNFLFDERVLPPTVVVLDYAAPRPEGEEGEDEGAAEDDEAEEENADAPEELDDEGNPKPKPPPKVKVFDPTDDKQYRKLIKKLLAKLHASTESSGTEPEPPAEGQPPIKPFQAFNVISINCYGRTAADIQDDIVLAVHPLSVPAVPPQDGEDILPEPEVEEGDTRNPLVIPGPKAVHQFGSTLKFCPVSLRDRGLLIYGDTSYWMSYKGKKYSFASPEAMAQFKRNPRRYAEHVKATVPPRLWILGVPASGKRTLAQRLKADFDIPLFEYSDSFFGEMLAAALQPEGTSTTLSTGLVVPGSPENPFVQRALKVSNELKAFDEEQHRCMELKDKTQKEQNDREERRENGDDVEELDEEEEAEIQKILEFEPEEAEAREERVSKAGRQIAAALTRVAPFEHRGYVLVGRPQNETECQGLLDEGAYPDAVVYVKASTETFVLRHIHGEYEKRRAVQEAKQAEVVAKRKAIQLKQREIELRKWRRRNIGADDAADGDEVEEAPEDVEQVTMEAVRADLEAQYETESANINAVVGALPDRRVPVIELSGDGGAEQMIGSALDQLLRVLQCRRSMFHAPQPITYSEAVELVKNGQKMVSVFGTVDPVDLLDERQGFPYRLRMKPNGTVVCGEEEIPEEPEEAPKEKKMRTVTKVNEDGEEYEVQEEEPEEEAEAPPEPEPEEPLEPEPEYSQEELDEMRKEHEEKLAVKAKAKQRKAAVLGHRVYFFNNDANLLRFVLDPLKFWDQYPPLPEIDGPVVAVLEPTPAIVDERKPRTMAEHLAFNTNAVYISMPKLLQWGALRPTLGYLHRAAKEALVRGAQPPSDAVATLLVHRLKSADALARGTVLENLPRDALQLKELYGAQLNISKCFTFNVLKEAADAVQAYAAVVHAVEHPPYTMASLHEMVSAARSSNYRQREHLLRVSLGFPASTFHTPVREADILERRSQYKWYCPYMWTRHEQLVEIPTDRRYVVEYLGKFFCMSTKEFFDEFLVHPEAVSGESTNYAEPNESVKSLVLPTVLPTHLSASAAAAAGPLELAGCCPVTLYQSRLRIGLRGVTEPIAIKGDATRFVAQYDGKYYALLNEECMTFFLRQPWVFAKYAVLPPPDKLPFDESTLATASDDIFITRTIKEATARAMLAVCKERPKYPGLTAEESALKYIALFLKAQNPRNSEVARRQYQANFELFAKEATLYKTITTEAPTDEEGLRQFHELCAAWDRVQDQPDAYKSYIHLRRDHEATQ